ncbi:hypothetical protein [Aquimarina sp. 2201CG5-10]|uniref:hypothetical protein n=1 Tax=Aquimarina callyspongiae TaxID=3098150 RepID=UPI002AB33C1B|nr:hypothetical protein [Aquimarina sp. 2201CG5-10]MDY8137424.1 hypothetical protein [Aquimarina sp. 2201CG5-10]
MKRPFKKLKAILFLGLLVLVIHSCTNDDSETELNQKEFSSLKLDFDEFDKASTKEVFNEKTDDLRYLKGSNILVDLSKSDAKFSKEQTEIVQVTTAEIDRGNLNALFLSLPEYLDILTISILENNNKKKKGLIVHYTDDKGFLRLAVFQKSLDAQTFEQIDFPVNLVSSFSLENILYVSRMLFPNSNITTIGANGIKTVKPSNKYDDMSLLRFITKYNIPSPAVKNSVLSKSLQKSARFGDEIIEGPGGGRPCALAVHHCNNGDSRRTQCHPFAGGCRAPVTCPRNSTLSALQTNQMTSQYNTMAANLPDNNLYNLRDWLETKPEGGFYVDAYYSMAPHFEGSLNIGLLYDISNASFDMKNFVTAVLNNDGNYVLNQTSYNKFVNIAQASAQNSPSVMYKDLVNSLVQQTQKYKSKNVQQIKSFASADVGFH